MDVLKNALSDLCCADLPLGDELIEQVESSLAEADLQLGEAEEFLKQALTSTDPPEVLQKRVSVVTADLEVRRIYINNKSDYCYFFHFTEKFPCFLFA